MIGKRTSTVNSKLLAFRCLQKKIYYFVGNVAEGSDDDIKKYMEENLDVVALSCSEIKKQDEDLKKSPKRWKSFHVCIKAEDESKFLDVEKWPQYIIIRRWVFKGKSTLNNRNNNPPSDVEKNVSNNVSSEMIEQDMITEMLTEGSGTGEQSTQSTHEINHGEQ